FLAAFEVEIARRVHLTYVARAQPAFVGRYRLHVAAPVTGRDVVAAHENFARLVELHLLAGHRLAYRAAPDLERVIDADERGRFRHPIALHNGIAEPLPEQLALRIQGRAARDKGPEFPA